VTAHHKIPVYNVYKAPGHPALALGMLSAYARHYKGGVLADTYEFFPRVLKTAEEAHAALDAHGPGVILSSHYIWSHHKNMEIARLMSDWAPDSVVVCGGPSIPKYERTNHAFLESCPEVDVTVRGEGEVTTAELLEQLAGNWTASLRDRGCLSKVAGITYRPAPRCPVDMVQRTGDRPRVVDVDTLPSPYLTGCFDGEDFSLWGSAIIETNRGCPYGCTFCDWGAATNSKVRKFDLERVRAEVEWIAKRQINGLWIADANFGIFQRDVEIAEMIVAFRREYGYPRQVIVNYAKHSSERLAEIVGLLRAAGVMADGIISIQTQDPETLVNIHRENIKTQHYDKLIRVFRQRQLRVSTDLMIGLPGATIASYKADLQFFFDRGVFAKSYPTILLPNSPMADPEYLQKYDIKVDARNGHLRSSYSYTPEDLLKMKHIYFFYKMLVGYGMLKYVLYYLQYDHRIPALTVVDDVRRTVKEQPERLPMLAALMRELLKTRDNLRRPMWRRTAEEWEEIHGEIERFVEAEYGVSGPGLRAMLKIQAKLLPGRGRVLPERVEAPYDVAAYFQTLQEAWGAPVEAASTNDCPPLDSYGPGVLDISDPLGFSSMTEEEIPWQEGHQLDWELASPLASGAAVGLH
jgi:radical SAM superfamily enzyme YgiQ (UPF0313 family)